LEKRVEKANKTLRGRLSTHPLYIFIEYSLFSEKELPVSDWPSSNTRVIRYVVLDGILLR